MGEINTLYVRCEETPHEVLARFFDGLGQSPPIEDFDWIYTGGVEAAACGLSIACQTIRYFGPIYRILRPSLNFLPTLNLGIAVQKDPPGVDRAMVYTLAHDAIIKGTLELIDGTGWDIALSFEYGGVVLEFVDGEMTLADRPIIWTSERLKHINLPYTVVPDIDGAFSDRTSTNLLILRDLPAIWTPERLELIKIPYSVIPEIGK